MNLTVGDHIRVKRNASLNYYHHGIYIGYQSIYELGGYGQYVVHFSGPDNTKIAAKISITTLNDFLNGGSDVKVINYPTSNGPSLSADTVVGTALYYVNNPAQWGAYDLVTNNCEHFAIYCKTGKKINPFFDQNQVKSYVLMGLLLGGLILLGKLL